MVELRSPLAKKYQSCAIKIINDFNFINGRANAVTAIVSSVEYIFSACIEDYSVERRLKDKYLMIEEVFNNKGVSFNSESLKSLIRLRNVLSHDVDKMFAVKLAGKSYMPEYNEVKLIDEYFFGDDYYVDFMQSFCRYCTKSDLKGYVENYSIVKIAKVNMKGW